MVGTGNWAILELKPAFQFKPPPKTKDWGTHSSNVQPTVRSIHYQETDDTPIACLRTLLHKSKLTTPPKLIWKAFQPPRPACILSISLAKIRGEYQHTQSVFVRE